MRIIRYHRYICIPLGRLLTITPLIVACLPGAGHAQSLNDVVAEQLGFGPFLTQPCYELRESGTLVPSDVFTGTLVDLCERSAPLPGAGPSLAAGGGAATPTTLPAIVQKRLRESRAKKTKTKTQLPAASADVTTKYKSGLSVFISAENERLNREVTNFEDGYSSDILRIALGADYTFAPGSMAGVTFDYQQHKGDFEGGGDFQTDTYGILGFASFLPMDRLYFQILAGWSKKEYARTRIASLSDIRITTGERIEVVRGSLSSENDGDEIRAGMSAGYEFRVNNVSLIPWGGLDWVNWKFNGYNEQGSTTQSFNNFIPVGNATGLELSFYDEEQTSLQSNFSIQALVNLRSGSWQVVPQAGVGWKHEFENDQRDVQMSFTGDTRAKRFAYNTEVPDRDWFEVSAGVAAFPGDSVQIIGFYRTMLGHQYFDSHTITVSFRLLF